jgi:hypothetical protein
LQVQYTDSQQQGEEVLHLPTIVEAAESSPAAAKECAHQIRKFLKSENSARPYVQYNGIMLMRILSDNPGATFTKNIDGKFIGTLKDLLRMGRDPSVQQILRETLENFEREKNGDGNLAPLVEMWKKEKLKMLKLQNGGVSILYLLVAAFAKYFQGSFGRTTSIPSRPTEPQQNYFARSHHSMNLPPPAELASRLEEARNSAKLLTQVVQSTPADEILSNELIKEFADRCLSASRSIQMYMVAENPGPDNDTMLTLIETNEQLSLAMTKHQRAVLNTRKALGVGTPEQRASPTTATGGFAPPAGPPPGVAKASTLPPRTTAVPAPIAKDEPKKLAEEEENPFADPKSDPEIDAAQSGHHLEPYHPGFVSAQSYVGRQDSAVGDVTLRAVGSERDDKGRNADDEDENDPYSAPSKEPIYRY